MKKSVKKAPDEVDNYFGVRSQTEVAEIMGISRARLYQIERRALLKLRRHPIIQQLATDYGLTGDSDA